MTEQNVPQSADVQRPPTGGPPPLQAPSVPVESGSGGSEARDKNEKRFQLELEFIHCLANPWYLHDLAQRGFFDDAAFINYLKYLKYWQKPDYAKFVIYPHTFHFLDLLQNAQFREKLKTKDWATFIHQKQYFHWAKWRDLDGPDDGGMADESSNLMSFTLENGHVDAPQGENGISQADGSSSMVNGQG